MSVTYRYAHADELPSVARLITHSFPHATRTPEWWVDQLRHTLYGEGPEVLWVGEEAGRIVAACQLHRLHQWIAGAAFPVMGLATVTIAPTHRRRGLAGEMVATALRAARDRGDLASALYPFRATFYGKYGYASAGVVEQYRVPPESFPRGEERSRVEVVDSAVARAEVQELYRRWAMTQTGQLVRTTRVWDHLLATPDRALALYRGEDGAPRGYALVVYRTDLPIPDRFLSVEELVWLDAEARRGLLSWLGTLGDQWHQIVVRCLPEQRLGDLLQESRLARGTESGWGLWYPSATLLRGTMFRLLDLEAAWQLRAVAPDASLTMALDVQDAQLAENAGSWRIRLAGGRATVERGGSPPDADVALALDVATLSRLFIGDLSPSAAVREERATVAGGAERLAELDRALAIPEPWTFDRF